MAFTPLENGCQVTQLDTEFKRGLGLYASTMIVVGSMIGSGIFLVSAEMARQTASPGLLLTHGW
jgi:APA family basic amino acid/polyamine antiporter